MKTKTKTRGYIVRSVMCLVLCSFALIAFSSAFNLSNRSPKSVMPVRGSGRAGTDSNQPRTLAFADRVAYQRAIEQVYWRHRIWPKERPDPKPSLEAVMSQAQIEKKVEDYLRDSQALEDYWQNPISPEQLQAEMERMVQHTKQPEVLRELFQALGDDPFVIAECLARPVLAQRVLKDLNDEDHVELTKVAWVRDPSQSSSRAETQVRLTMAQLNANYTLPGISSPLGSCVDDTWTQTSLINAPDGRQWHTAVWTGSEMIVWGGYNGTISLNTGGKYNPSTDSWTATTTTEAPSARNSHTALWTGSEMIVWGGSDGSNPLNTGGRYNPSTDSWTATSTTNAPTSRAYYAAIWTGSEMIVWGGWDGTNYLNTGGRYDPSTDSWIATSTTNAPSPRWFHTAVWTGSEMIIWGGYAPGAPDLNTGGRYNPSSDSWAATSTTNAPIGRTYYTAVWTGSEMIIWGGVNCNPGCIFPNIGGRYNPSSDSWTATSTTNAPTGRVRPTAVWTGSEMIVWGGLRDIRLNTGGKYDPGADSWTATSLTNAPSARELHTAVWTGTGTGSQMIIWGGYGSGPTYFNTGGRYCAQSGATPTPTATPTATATPQITPTPRSRPSPGLRPTPPPHLTPVPPPPSPRPTPYPRP